MSVSSINPYLEALYAQYYTSGIDTATTQSAQSSSTSAAVRGISGVDSFERSTPTLQAGYTAEMAGANRAQFGPPPPPGDSANASGSSTDDPVKSFLDKVAAGTVTDEDLTDMQTLLKQWQQTTAK